MHTPKYSLHPRKHLPGAKGLGDVVVRAHLQPQQLVEFLALRREHYDWYIGILADLTAQHQAVHAGHHDIQYHNVRAHALDLFKGLIAVIGGNHLVAFPPEIGVQRLVDIRIVVGNQYLITAAHLFHKKFRLL